MATDTNKWFVEQGEMEEIALDAWNELLLKYNFTTSDNPTAFLLGGQPGAGKSTSQERIINNYFNGNAIFISMDDFREHHPDFDEICSLYEKDQAVYTHKFAGAVADIIVQKAIEHKYNIVVESTFKNYNGAVKTLDMFKKNGYECNIVVVTCPTELSLFGTKNRIDKDRSKGLPVRGVPTDIHDEAIRVLAENAQKLYEGKGYNTFEIRNRDKELYNNQNDIYKDKTPKKVIKDELDRSLSKDEIDFIKESSIKYKQALEENKAKLEKEEEQKAVLAQVQQNLTKLDVLYDLEKNLDETRAFKSQHLGGAIIESSKVKNILGVTKIDEQKLEKNINEALTGHFKLHQKTVSIINNFFSQLKTMGDKIKTLFVEDKKEIEQPKKAEKSIKKSNDKSKGNDIEM